MSDAPRRKRVVVEHAGSVAVAGFAGETVLDEQTLPMIGEDLFQIVDELGHRRLLLDFTGVVHMTSAPLGRLVRLHHHILQLGGALVLCGLAPRVRDVFALTMFDRMMTIRDDRPAGLAAF